MTSTYGHQSSSSNSTSAVSFQPTSSQPTQPTIIAEIKNRNKTIRIEINKKIKFVDFLTIIKDKFKTSDQYVHFLIDGKMLSIGSDRTIGPALEDNNGIFFLTDSEESPSIPTQAESLKRTNDDHLSEITRTSKRPRVHLPAPWLAGPSTSNSFKDSLTEEFRLLNKVAFDQACETLRCPVDTYDRLKKHPSFICILDGPGVGKSRFIQETAKKAKAHVFRTSFKYGVLKSVIDKADNPKHRYAPATEVVKHICNLFRAAFLTIFNQASDEISLLKESGSPIPPLDVVLTKNYLSDYKDEDIAKLMEIKLKYLGRLLEGAAMVIVMDETQYMGTLPGKLRKYDSIQELISDTKITYPETEFIDDEVTPLARHFVSIALHLVLQEVVPIGLSKNIAIAILGLDPTLDLHQALSRSGLTTFSFCQDIVNTLPYFTYNDVEAVVGQYIDLKLYPSTEVASVIAQLTGPPRITEIFLETYWQKQTFRHLSGMINETFISFCSRYNLSNVTDGKTMLQTFFTLTYFPARFGGSVIYEDKKIVVEYPEKTDGYDIIAKYRSQISVTGIVRVQLIKSIPSKAFRINEPYPFACRVLREIAGFESHKDIIVGSLMCMKEMGGELFEYAVAKELSFKYSPIYGRILQVTGYDALPRLEQMVFEPFNTIETRNDSNILDEEHQSVRWIRDKNSRDTMKVDVWTFGYNDTPTQGMPTVIDIFVQVTKQKDGVDQKFDETLRHWLSAVPTLHEKPAIFVFVSRHPVSIPNCVDLKNGIVTYAEVQRPSQQMKEQGPPHWLIVFSGSELNNTIIPLLELADDPPADIMERYNF